MQVFSGHMKLVDVPYDQKLEDTSSKEFEDLADNLQAIVSLTPQKDDLSYFCSLSVVHIVYCELF